MLHLHAPCCTAYRNMFEVSPPSLSISSQSEDQCGGDGPNRKRWNLFKLSQVHTRVRYQRKRVNSLGHVTLSSDETHVDDGVRLDVVHVRVAEAQLFASPLGGADDAGGDGVLEGERAADGDHKLAGTKVRRPAEQQHRQLHLLQQTQREKYG